MYRHCFALFALMSLCPTAGARAEIVGQPIQRVASEDEMKASLARMVLVDEAGTKLGLAALLRGGKPTLVSLWAHWCPN